MDISQFNSFVTALNNIDSSKAYVAKDSSGNFLRTSKNQKNLNTKDIATLGQEALRFIADSQLSYSKKAQMYTQLSSAISSYNNRVYNQKNIFFKFAAWLGFYDKSEKKLFREYDTSLQQAKTFQMRDQNIRNTFQNARWSTQDLSKERIFFASIMDSLPITHPELEGMTVSHSIQWMRNHLIEYKKHLSENEADTSQVDALIHELDDCLLFDTIDHDSLKVFTDAKDWTTSEVLDRIATLEKIGQEIAIPGGFRSEKGGHFSIYRIRLESIDNGKKHYSFTLINSGLGAPVDKKNLREHIEKVPDGLQKHEELRKQGTVVYSMGLMKMGVRRSVIDRVWKPVPEEAFNKVFIGKLFDLRSAQDMEIIMKTISDHFASYSVAESQGRTHKAQNKGSCGLKAITSWFHERMGDPMWRDFKVFYTQKELTKLPQLEERYRETFKPHAENILAKRKRKAHKKELP